MLSGDTNIFPDGFSSLRVPNRLLVKILIEELIPMAADVQLSCNEQKLLFRHIFLNLNRNAPDFYLIPRPSRTTRLVGIELNSFQFVYCAKSYHTFSHSVGWTEIPNMSNQIELYTQNTWEMRRWWSREWEPGGWVVSRGTGTPVYIQYMCGCDAWLGDKSRTSENKTPL